MKVERWVDLTVEMMDDWLVETKASQLVDLKVGLKGI